MVGPTKHCLLTLVERKTRFTIICPVQSRTIEEINTAALIALQPYRKAVKSITFDNGTEFHGYKALEEHLGITVYFAHPHHSWERGTNENTNGLIRQYAPKRITLRHMNIYRCGWVSRLLNERPRKVLAYRNPKEAFSEEMNCAL
jgi:IS30 family transposase